MTLKVKKALFNDNLLQVRKWVIPKWGLGLGKNRVKELISYNPTNILKTAE